MGWVEDICFKHMWIETIDMGPDENEEQTPLNVAEPMVCWFLTKLKILLLCNPAVMLFGIYPKELRTYIHTKTCMWIFIAILIIIAET